MFAKIRHVAMYTHNHAVVDSFYQTIFGMRRMTSGTLDETGKQNQRRNYRTGNLIALCRHAVRHGPLRLRSNRY